MDSVQRLEIERKVSAGERLTREDGVAVLDSDDLSWLGGLAQRVRERRYADRVSFVVSRWVDGSGDPVAQASRAAADNVTELHVWPDPAATWPSYPDLLRTLKRAAPDVRLTAFTGADLHRLAADSGGSMEAVLDELIGAGLDALAAGNPSARTDPAEDWQRWAAGHRLAHAKGMATGAALYFAAGEQSLPRIERVLRLRDLQDEITGFTSVTPVLLANQERPSPIDGLRMAAVCRLLLDNIPHVSVDWPAWGVSVAMLALQFGVDDLDTAGAAEAPFARALRGAGRAPGAAEPLPRDDLVELIHDAGFRPVERDGRYAVVREYPPPPPLAERRSIPQQVWS